MVLSFLFQITPSVLQVFLSFLLQITPSIPRRFLKKLYIPRNQINFVIIDENLCVFSIIPIIIYYFITPSVPKYKQNKLIVPKCKEKRQNFNLF
jgi:hypothetical protein